MPDLVLAELQRLVEIVVLKKGAALVDATTVNAIDADNVEIPGVATVELAPDLRAHWNAIADLPAVFIGEQLPDDEALAIPLPGFDGLGRQLDLRINRQQLFRIRRVHLHRALRVLVDAAEPVEWRHCANALRHLDLLVVRTRQRNRHVQFAHHQQPVRAHHVDGLRKTGAQCIEHAEHEKGQQDRDEREHQPQFAATKIGPDDWQPAEHQMRRNASTILRRIAVSAGHRPVRTPNTSISAAPTRNVFVPIWNTGK